MKNKSLITNICLTLLSVLVIAFIALPYLGNAYATVSGYDCFEMFAYMDGAPVEYVLAYVAPLLMLIAAAITLIFSILGLLGDLNVIKSGKCLKVARLVNLIAAIALAVFTLLGFIMAFVIELSPAVGLILNLVFAIAIVVGVVLNRVWNRK